MNDSQPRANDGKWSTATGTSPDLFVLDAAVSKPLQPQFKSEMDDVAGSAREFESSHPGWSVEGIEVKPAGRAVVRFRAPSGASIHRAESGFYVEDQDAAATDDEWRVVGSDRARSLHTDVQQLVRSWGTNSAQVIDEGIRKP
jgi:hypothetical protein